MIYRPIPLPILCPIASISDHFGARITQHLHNRSAIQAVLPANVPEFASLCNLIPFRTPVFRSARYESPTETVCLREVAVIRVDRVLNRPATHYLNEVTWHTHPFLLWECSLIVFRPGGRAEAGKLSP